MCCNLLIHIYHPLITPSAPIHLCKWAKAVGSHWFYGNQKNTDTFYCFKDCFPRIHHYKIFNFKLLLTFLSVILVWFFFCVHLRPVFGARKQLVCYLIGFCCFCILDSGWQQQLPALPSLTLDHPLFASPPKPIQFVFHSFTKVPVNKFLNFFRELISGYQLDGLFDLIERWWLREMRLVSHCVGK